MKDGAGSGEIRKARRPALLAVAVWFLAAIVAGSLGVVNEPGRPPLVLLSLFALPMLGFAVAFAASASLRAFAESIPLWVLVGSHLWRFVGIGFVIGWLTGALPAGFGIPAGFGDIVAALGALVLLRRARRGTASRGWVLAWNIVGTIDLVAAITLGLLYSQSKLGVLSTATSSTVLLTMFPVSLIPTFFVPLFLLMHALTYRRVGDLRDSSSAGATFLRRDAARGAAKGA